MSDLGETGRSPNSRPEEPQTRLRDYAAGAGPEVHTSARMAPRWSWFLAVALLLAIAVIASLAVARSGRPVTVIVDGHSETVRTHRAGVGEFLMDLGLTLRPEDQVLPPVDTPLVSGMLVTVQRARPGLVLADGSVWRASSRALTVGELVAEAGVRLAPYDEIWLGGEQVNPDSVLPLPELEPGPRWSVPARSWAGRQVQPFRLTIRRAVRMTVDDGSVPYDLFTTAPTVGEALLREQVSLYLGDQVQPGLGARVHAGMRVVIRRSKPILVTADGRTVQTRTQGKTVGDALTDLGIPVVGRDRVEPALTERVIDYLPIHIVRVRETVQVESELIPFESIMAPDDNLPIDQQQLQQQGQAGEFRRRYRLVYEDQVEVSRTLTDAWVAAEPITHVVAYGHKIESMPLDTPQGTLSYWRKVPMYATSYSAATAGRAPDDPLYGITRSGARVRTGLVAVDPTLIPLGSRLYVPGYGIAVAADTGGGVRARMIDLGYDDGSLVHWSRWVDVYYLDPPPAASKIRWLLPNWPPR